MKPVTALVIAGLVGSSASGCTVQDLAAAGLIVSTPQPGVVVAQEPPPLVSVDPNVAVVEDSPVPVYYADNSYWSVRNGSWYQARYWDAPWSLVNLAMVPANLAYRDHRHYQHYRGPKDAHRWRESREHGHHDGDHGERSGRQH